MPRAASRKAKRCPLDMGLLLWSSTGDAARQTKYEWGDEDHDNDDRRDDNEGAL